MPSDITSISRDLADIHASPSNVDTDTINHRMTEGDLKNFIPVQAMAQH